MNAMIGLIGGLGNTEIILIVLVIVLLFGASRLPQLAKSLGQSKRAFREGMDEADEEARLDAKRRASLRAADEEVRRDDVPSDKFTVNKPR
jgi:sec-independent protein translocase protein TatA